MKDLKGKPSTVLSASSPDTMIRALLSKTAKKLDCKITETSQSSTKARIKRRLLNKTGTKFKKDVETEETNSEEDLPLAIRLVNSDSAKSQDVIFPHITRSNWRQFERQIKNKETKMTEDLNKCIARMHGYEVFDNHFSSRNFLRLTIVESLLNRKWDNLLRLVVILGRNNNEPVFRMFIRHLCLILKQYHPSIRGTEFEDQIDLIVEKHDRKHDSNVV